MIGTNSRFSALRMRYVTGGIIVVILGVVFFVLYVLYVLFHESYLQGPVWLLPLGILLVGVLSAGLIYGGHWIATSDFTTEQGWVVVIWLFTGVVAALALTFWPIFYQRIVGVAIEDPLFILLVSSGFGANSGVVAGVSKVQFDRQLNHVQQARDAFEFLNRLLRHNILNALTIIHGNAEFVVEEAPSDTTAERAQTISDQSENIDALIQNVGILVERIEGDADLESVDITKTVTNEVATARQTYDEAIIETDLAPDVDIRADPLVSAVIENLVRNAIIHNDQETPRVVVTLETTDSLAVLQIADNGPGLPAESKDALINPGDHGDQGIGLYLVDTLISQYGGEIQFDGNDPRGTVVTIELPLA